MADLIFTITGAVAMPSFEVYNLEVANLTLSPTPPFTVFTNQEITASSATDLVTFHYSTNGIDPNFSSPELQFIVIADN